MINRLGPVLTNLRPRWYISLILIGAFVHTGPVAAQTGPASGNEIFSLFENVDPLVRHEDGTRSFGVREKSIRFSVGDQTVDAQRHIETIIQRSIDEGLSVTIRFNALAGRFDDYSFSFLYPLCSISIDEGAAGSDEICIGVAAEQRAERISWTHHAIARAIALTQAGRYAEAREPLDRALGQQIDDPGVEFLGHRTRARVLQALALDYPRSSPEADALYLLALPDLRASLSYYMVDGFLSIAGNFRALGAYDEALRVYDAVPPTSVISPLIRAAGMAGIYRLRDRHAMALLILRDLEASQPEHDGMMLRINLARSLLALDRYEEAIAELTRGLATQPDYAWAYYLRSCAYASMGSIEQALSDERQGMEAFMRYADLDLAAADHNLARTRERLALLEQLAVDAPEAPAPEICDGWFGEGPRERSPLLENVDLRVDDIVEIGRTPPEE